MLWGERGWALLGVDADGRASTIEVACVRVCCRRHVAALHHANIDTLERIGGGGVRCTLAEIF